MAVIIYPLYNGRYKAIFALTVCAQLPLLALIEICHRRIDCNLLINIKATLWWLW